MRKLGIGGILGNKIMSVWIQFALIGVLIMGVGIWTNFRL